MQTNVQQLATLLRYYSLVATTAAGSGHPTSSLSAADLMAVLFFGGHFKTRLHDHEYHNNDRLIFSKGHASPLLYALYTAAGVVTKEDLLTLRKIDSRLEGHPTMEFEYTEVATGSLGQGLSVGVGMALNAQYLDGVPYHTYVLLGDSEMAEGSNWEALQIAAHYNLHQLVGILDVNGLGQRGETMAARDVEDYASKVKSFGWQALVVDGHDCAAIDEAYEQARREMSKPTMIIADTLKGKGVSFLENQHGWHGKALSDKELQQALAELGPVNTHTVAAVAEPEDVTVRVSEPKTLDDVDVSYSEPLATRKAYGHALVEMAAQFPNMVVLDAEVSNSTYAEYFRKHYPERFFEMYIAEQNMVGVASGLARRGKMPFVSTFASFFSRAYDQIRVSQYSLSSINFVGSHVGVSTGEDGATQMGLEDIALFRSILGSTVVYPADHVSCEQLAVAMAQQPGICYMRTTRMDTQPLYDPAEAFAIGGSKTLRASAQDVVTVVAAGVTVYEAIKAHDVLASEGIAIRVIDLYSIKPIDGATLQLAAAETSAIITVEDHFAEGGMGEAVMSALATERIPIHALAVRKMPHSGKPAELLSAQAIDAAAIIATVRVALSTA